MYGTLIALNAALNVFTIGVKIAVSLCRYDVPSAIPDGSIQRAGENVLALLREVANSPSLSNPDADDLHGNVIFFDIFGIITVVYPEKVSMVMNFVLAFLVALLMIKDINWNSSPKSGRFTEVRGVRSQYPFPTLYITANRTGMHSLSAPILLATGITTSHNTDHNVDTGRTSCFVIVVVLVIRCCLCVCVLGERGRGKPHS